MRKPKGKVLNRRLEKLADLLEKVAAIERRRKIKKFNMFSWAEGDLGLTKNLCGSSGCALGWATAIPEFRKAGLHLEYGEPCYNGYYGEAAAEAFFEITAEAADQLFLSNFTASAAEKAAEIRVVARNPNAQQERE